MGQAWSDATNHGVWVATLFFACVTTVLVSYSLARQVQADGEKQRKSREMEARAVARAAEMKAEQDRLAASLQEQVHRSVQLFSRGDELWVGRSTGEAKDLGSGVLLCPAPDEVDLDGDLVDDSLGDERDSDDSALNYGPQMWTQHFKESLALWTTRQFKLENQPGRMRANAPDRRASLLWVHRNNHAGRAVVLEDWVVGGVVRARTTRGDFWFRLLAVKDTEFAVVLVVSALPLEGVQSRVATFEAKQLAGRVGLSVDGVDLGTWVCATEDRPHLPGEPGDMVIGPAFANQGWTPFLMVNARDVYRGSYHRHWRQSIVAFRTTLRTLMRFDVEFVHYVEERDYFILLGTCTRLEGQSTHIASEISLWGRWQQPLLGVQHDNSELSALP